MSSPKSGARHVALQALYQWQMTGDNLQDIQNQFEESAESGAFHKNYFKSLLFGVVEKLSELDEIISQFTDRELEKIDPIEKAVLRLGTFEMLCKQEVPFRVVINESVDLAKRFGSEKSHAYVNSILDKVAYKTRPLEMPKAKRKKAQSKKVRKVVVRKVGAAKRSAKKPTVRITKAPSKKTF